MPGKCGNCKTPTPTLCRALQWAILCFWPFHEFDSVMPGHAPSLERQRRKLSNCRQPVSAATRPVTGLPQSYTMNAVVLRPAGSPCVARGPRRSSDLQHLLPSNHHPPWARRTAANCGSDSAMASRWVWRSYFQPNTHRQQHLACQPLWPTLVSNPGCLASCAAGPTCWCNERDRCVLAQALAAVLLLLLPVGGAKAVTLLLLLLCPRCCCVRAAVRGGLVAAARRAAAGRNHGGRTRAD